MSYTKQDLANLREDGIHQTKANIEMLEGKLERLAEEGEKIHAKITETNLQLARNQKHLEVLSDLLGL